MKYPPKELSFSHRLCAYCGKIPAKILYILPKQVRRDASMGQIPGTIQRADKKRDLQKQISYIGAGDEARTRYLHLGKVALYRMSYTRGTR